MYETIDTVYVPVWIHKNVLDEKFVNTELVNS